MPCSTIRCSLSRVGPISMPGFTADDKLAVPHSSGRCTVPAGRFASGPERYRLSGCVVQAEPPPVARIASTMLQAM